MTITVQRRHVSAALALAMTASRPARAQEAVPLLVPGTTQRDIEGPSGQPFRIFLYVPPGDPPPGGWPMVTVVDANAVMGQVVDTIRLLTFLPVESGVRSAAVVAGIGYRTDGPYDLVRRTFDLTPPPGRIIPAVEGRPGARTGGADELLDFIEAVVKPLAARAAPIDQTRYALLGHSFGGLFALHALFTRPGNFRDYVAGSPAVWWEDAAILGAAGSFAAMFDRLPPLRLLVTVGEYEQHLAPWHDLAWKPRMDSMQMVDRARDLAEQLRPLPGLDVEFKLMTGETHMTAFPQAVQRGLRFILAR